MSRLPFVQINNTVRYIRWLAILQGNSSNSKITILMKICTTQLAIDYAQSDFHFFFRGEIFFRRINQPTNSFQHFVKFLQIPSPFFSLQQNNRALNSEHFESQNFILSTAIAILLHLKKKKCFEILSSINSHPFKMIFGQKKKTTLALYAPHNRKVSIRNFHF